jgi:hypothetical protein
MAGDWIKVEQATLDKPEVLRAAEMLNIHRREALGLFVEFWIWLDKNLSASCPDFVRNMSAKSLDEVLHTPGFSGVLKSIGWAKFDDEQSVLYVMNAERHNGNTAKSRALDAKRKKEKRQESVRETSGCEPDRNRTREEKRRDITPVVPTPQFEEFWRIYPGPRKVGKSKCLAHWHSAGFEAVGDQIILHVQAMKLSTQWREADGKYIPAPQTYLNQRRFEDGLPESPRPRLVI